MTFLHVHPNALVISDIWNEFFIVKGTGFVDLSTTFANISPLPWKSLLEKEERQQINVIGGKIHAWTMHVYEVEQIGFEFKVFGLAENWATIDPLPLHHFHPE